MRLIVVLILSLGWVFSRSIWDGQTRFTIVEHTSDQIQIRSFDPSSMQGTVVKIPDDLDITSLAGRGTWPAKNIFRAGTAQWASESIINYLGLTYIGFWDSLSIWNKLAWKQYQGKVSWNNVDLTRGGLTTLTKTSDGFTVRHLTPLWFDQTKQLFSSQVITDKRLSLAIVNTTDATGLGSHAADVAESMGFKVDSVTDDPQTIQKCVLEAPTQDSAIKALARVFDCDIKPGSLKMRLGESYKAILR